MTVSTTNSDDQIVTIAYSDLLKFGNKNGNSNQEVDRKLIQLIGQAYGQDGLGILAVTGVPNLEDYRQKLLPLALRIADLPKEELAKLEKEEACYAVGWSHGKEELTPGVPDFSKGSFYANPLVDHLPEAMLQRHQLQPPSQGEEDTSDFEANLSLLVTKNPAFFAPNVWPSTLPELRDHLMQLGQLIKQIGCLVARVCECYCKQQGVLDVPLEQILDQSLNCKARLLHYFETPEDDALGQDEDNNSRTLTQNKMWCGWHNDHGSLTGLVPAVYYKGSNQLQSNPDPEAGLYIQSRQGQRYHASLPNGSLGFQIGETFQILSGGVLQATPHAVQSTKLPSITRETLAVFLEPEYEFPLTIPPNKSLKDVCPPATQQLNAKLQLNNITSRYKPGMTFGAFNDITIQTFHKQLEGHDEEAKK